MIYLVTQDPKNQRVYLEECENFDCLISILELTPFYYNVYATMNYQEANNKRHEWLGKEY